MADPFILPPEADDFQLNVTLHRQAMPYVTEWYQAMKKPAETPEQFLRRLIYRHALQFRLQKIGRQVDDERQAAEETSLADRDTLEDDFTSTVGTVESL